MTSQAKRKEIESILTDLEKSSPSDAKKSQLERLKVLGRDPNGADELFTRRGIGILVEHGLDGTANAEAAREALSCLANCLLLQPSTRSMAVELGAASRVAVKYRDVAERMDEFLCARLLLFMSVNTSCDLEDLLNNQQLADSIVKRIEHYAQQPTLLERPSPTVPSPSMEFSETLKLLHAAVKLCPEAADFSPTVSPLLDIFTAIQGKVQGEARQLLYHIIDALHVLPINEDTDVAYFPSNHETAVMEELVASLDQTLATGEPPELDLKLSSTLVLLLRLYPRAPDSVKVLLREKLLPREEERSKPLGQARSLSGRLLRISTSGHTPQLRELIPELNFELSDRNAETFVNNVGYGYASGYLQNRKIPFTVPGTEGQVGTTGSQSSMRADVNPVTGQYFDQEPKSEGPQMTDEEKEREAERLFVLFERLKQTGVVQVKNPVEEAVQEGRFEELPDD